MNHFFFKQKEKFYSKIILIMINILRKGNFLRTFLIFFCNKGEGKKNIIKYFFTNIAKWLPISRILYNYCYIPYNNTDMYFQKNFRKSIGIKKKTFDESIVGIVVEVGKTQNKHYIILKNNFSESFFFLSFKFILKINKLKVKKGDLININKNSGKIDKLQIKNFFKIDKELIKKSFYFKVLNCRDLDYFNLFTHVYVYFLKGVTTDNFYNEPIMYKRIIEQIDIKILNWHIHKIISLSIGFVIIDDFSVICSAKIKSTAYTLNFLMYPNLVVFSDVSIKILLKKIENEECFFFNKFIKCFVFFNKKNKTFYKLIKKRIEFGIFSLAFFLLIFLVKKSAGKFYCYKMIKLAKFVNKKNDKKIIRNYLNTHYDIKRINIYSKSWYKKFSRNIININLG